MTIRWLAFFIVQNEDRIGVELWGFETTEEAREFIAAVKSGNIKGTPKK